MKVPTRRTLAKQQTRTKVLAAARRLFSEEGYEGATIRDIATAAGMSTGAVFANFADKSDLFREIMIADMTSLAAIMDEAAQRGASIDDALLKMFSAGYSFYQNQLPLARAAFSVGWSPQDGPVLRDSAENLALIELLYQQVARATKRGGLRADTDVTLHAEMLFETYLSNFGRAIFEGWTLDALQDRSKAQITVILAGVRT